MRWQFSVPLKLASKLKAYHRSIRWVSVNLNWLLGDGKNTSIHRMHELTPTNAYIVYMMSARASERVNGRTRGKYREKALQQTKVYFMCRIIENKSLSVLSTHIHKEPFIIVYSALVIYAAFRIWYVIFNCMQLLIFGVPTPFFFALSILARSSVLWNFRLNRFMPIELPIGFSTHFFLHFYFACRRNVLSPWAHFVYHCFWRSNG